MMMKQYLTFSAVLAACVLCFAAPALAANSDPCSKGSAQKRERCKVEKIVTGVKTPADVLAVYPAYYADDVQFNDPIGTAEGLTAVINKVIGGFDLLAIDSVTNAEYHSDGKGSWVATYTLNGHFVARIDANTVLTIGAPLHLEAVTAIKFDDCGKVYYHRDYYDLLIGTFGQVPNLVNTAFGIFQGWVGEQIGIILGGGAPPAP